MKTDLETDTHVCMSATENSCMNTDMRTLLHPGIDMPYMHAYIVRVFVSKLPSFATQYAIRLLYSCYTG